VNTGFSQANGWDEDVVQGMRSIITFRNGCSVNAIITFRNGIVGLMGVNDSDAEAATRDYCSGGWRE
jgi:hypothetical protein